ncbi:MAG: Na+/H+ antiporter NhaA, partial [Candidatus Hodarchaeota archaeon]
MAAIPMPKYFRKAQQKPIGRVIRPFREFMTLESSSGIIILASLLVALAWINSPFNESYSELWEMELAVKIGEFELSKHLIHWINDLLMAIFFLLVGLEIKREILIGELSSFKQASLPIMAAIGGMIVPAAIYILFNPPGSEGAKGWAVPMATDISIALGVLMLIGKRLPFSLKVFLTSVAIVDDIGAVIVIAVFYTSELYLDYLFLGILIVLMLFGLNALGVRHPLIYTIMGVVLWFFILKSGVHATIAGFFLAMSIPATTVIDYEEFKTISSGLVNKMNQTVEAGAGEDDINLKFYQGALQTLELACHDVESPLQRLEHG